MEKFTLGDLVKIKSGGPLMTVTDRGNANGNALETFVQCAWFVENKPQYGYFPHEALEKSLKETSGSVSN